MSNVNNSVQIHRSGEHTMEDINKIQRPAKARDNLKAAFAGRENKGPAGNKKESSRSTNVKSRTTSKSKTRTPVR